MARLVAKKIQGHGSSSPSHVEARQGEARAMVEAIDEAEALIAQELHDTVCQSMSGIRLSTAAIARRLRATGVGGGEELARIDDAAGKTIGELHDLIRALQPVGLEPGELRDALEELAMEARAPGTCQFRAHGQPRVQDAFTAAQVFRIARAAMGFARAGNAAAHVVISWGVVEKRCILEITADQPCFSGLAGPEQRSPWERLSRRAGAIAGGLEIVPTALVLSLALPTAAHARRLAKAALPGS